MSKSFYPTPVKYRDYDLTKQNLDELKRRVTKFHILMVYEHGKEALKRNLRAYMQLLIKYSVLHNKLFCSSIDANQIAKVVADLIDEIESD